MEIKDLEWWKFNGVLSENCEILCLECKQWSNHKEWTESEVYCEDCGSHAAIECPECHERFDHIWGPTFEIRGKK